MGNSGSYSSDEEYEQDYEPIVYEDKIVVPEEMVVSGSTVPPESLPSLPSSDPEYEMIDEYDISGRNTPVESEISTPVQVSPANSDRSINSESSIASSAVDARSYEDGDDFH